MSEALHFILTYFQRITVLKESDHGLTELVCSSENEVYVRKTLNYTNTVYKKLQQLDSSYLPKTIYCCNENNKTYVIEEYIKGRTLQEIVAVGPLEENLAEWILLQLCAALETLHTHNIIHRDLKPSNIMLTNAQKIVLLDFDVARDITSMAERDTIVLGTPGYAPPEQYGFAATDTRSDFYALGRTLRELLGKDYQGRLSKIIDKCTEFDPQRRVGSAAEVRRLLKRSKRQKWLAVAAVLAVIGGGAAYYLFAYNYTAAPLVQESQAMRQENKASDKALQTEQSSAEVEQSKAPEQTKAAEAEQNKASEQAKAVESEQSKTLEQTKAAEAEQKSAQPETKSGEQQIRVGLQSLNWDKFYQAEEDLLRDNIIREIEKQGFVYVKHRDGGWPTQIITNDSDMELKNPLVQLYFKDFAVCGESFAVEGWSGRTEQTEYSDAVYRTEYGQGVYRSVTLRLTGTVPAHDYAELSLFGGVGGYFVTGKNPRVTVVMSADNAASITQEYLIKF